MKRNFNIYFISGHRDITDEDFSRLYKTKIDGIIEREPTARFVVGDYQGVDIMAQNYLVEKGLQNQVIVFHMFDKPRNFNDKIRATMGGFISDEERDSTMTKMSDFDIAFVRKGKWNSGTAQNIKRRNTF